MSNSIKEKIAKVVNSYNVESLKIGYCSQLRTYHKYTGIWVTSKTNYRYLTAYIGTYNQKGEMIG